MIIAIAISIVKPTQLVGSGSSIPVTPPPARNTDWSNNGDWNRNGDWIGIT